MARETKAQREAREAAEREELLAGRRAAYPQLFIAVMAAALKENFELVEVNPETKAFTFFDRDESETFVVFMDFGTAGQSEWALDRLASAVEGKVAVRREAERVAALRRQARAKLTQEEAEALGLR